MRRVAYLTGRSYRGNALAPGDVRRSLPQTPPAGAEPLERIFADFESRILPGITHWNHPGFFAYFSISSSIPGILAELLIAALDVNAMLWKTSPAATELEQLTMDWLRQLLGLGDGWFGLINDTASISTMLALAAAREVNRSSRFAPAAWRDGPIFPRCACIAPNTRTPAWTRARSRSASASTTS